MIPIASNYPESFDTNTNLYEVHDALRLVLSEDYNPGDTTISWVGDINLAINFPSTGIITLTEQCSDIDERAISFFYTGIDYANNLFLGLEKLPEFKDVAKPKRLTNITINVVDRHHNSIKNAVIAIQEFIGVKGTRDVSPYGATMEGRINFLRRLVLIPRAWFTANKRIGLVPLEVEFKDLSFRLATDGETGPINFIWDFGDNTLSNVSMISTTETVPNVNNVTVTDLNGDTITKTYLSPGIFDVSLTVSNNFGSDTVVLPGLVNARLPAPDEAVIRFLPTSDQTITTEGVPTGGPYTTNPVIRTPVNTLISAEIPPGRNTNVTDKDVSFAGELLNSLGDPVDPIIEYTWLFGDDLSHNNASDTTASYSVGGLYDMKLRADTESGSFRITTYEDSIDVVERTNLWLWTYVGLSNNVRASEFGLISEVFKTSSIGTINLNTDDSFLDGVNGEERQKFEFRRNTCFAPRSTIGSGNSGTAFLFWASGRDSIDARSTEKIFVKEFKGFDVGGPTEYISKPSIDGKPWNWAALSFLDTSYFLFGSPLSEPTVSTSPVNNNLTNYNLLSQVVTSSAFSEEDFINGAEELLNNVAEFDAGESIFGNYSVYRTASKDSTGYILRNDGVGPFFRIKSFYRTEGIIGDQVQSIRKLTDMQGPTKVEGQLVALSTGLHFMSNSGSISVFGDQTSTWTTSGPGINSVGFRSLQDTSVSGFDSAENTLLAASDGDRRAYITFDYSPNSFLKFNEIDQTFTTLGSRTSGDQWVTGIY